MRLIELLSSLPAGSLDWLALQHGMTSEGVSRATLCSDLENRLRSFAEIQELTFGRQPPAFAMLMVLFEAPEQRLPRTAFSDTVTALTASLCADVTAGEVVSRPYEAGIYRRVLYEARRNDLKIDESEAALLAVLRRELGISRVEHFLTEHHEDLQEFWNGPGCFDKEFEALTTAGLLFVSGDDVVMAEDVAPLVGQALGVELAATPARRLFAHLSSGLLAEVLEGVGARTSGSKDDRIERLVKLRIQPSGVLRFASLELLRDISREVGARPYGSKEELTQRLIRHFASDGDLRPTNEVPAVEESITETRRLSRGPFARLFGFLRGQELAEILETFPELRQSGSKDARVAVLWASGRSENTLLASLRNASLETILSRCGLPTWGAKMVRIERLIAHAEQYPPDSGDVVNETNTTAAELSDSQHDGS